MSRIAKQPLILPAKVELTVKDRVVMITGPKGTLSLNIHESIIIKKVGDNYQVQGNADYSISKAMSGTTRVLLGNIVTGVTKGFEKKLSLIGVGYRAKVKNKILELNLGYSNPINYIIPEGISIEMPANNEIIVKGIDKQLVGQVAANIRKFREPERYKGKGVRYSDERVILKETKKK